MGAVTRQDPEISEIKGRLSAVEGKMQAIEIGQTTIAADLRAHTLRSDDRHEVLIGGQTATQAMVKELIERERAREEREEQHRREREAREHAASLESASWRRSLVSPQTVIIGLVILASAAGMRITEIPGVAAMLGLPVETSPAAATGIMGAGVAPAAAPGE